MPLTFDDNCAIDKFNKCKQQAGFLEQEVTNEGFLRFSDYAWHLRDWLKSDPSVPQAAKDEVRSWKDPLPCHELLVCRDVINADKHLEITRYDPIAEDVSSEHGFGRGRWGKGGWGIGEKEIQIRMKEGTLIDALAVVRAVVKFWEEFFARHFPA